MHFSLTNASPVQHSHAIQPALQPSRVAVIANNCIAGGVLTRPVIAAVGQTFTSSTESQTPLMTYHEPGCLRRGGREREREITPCFHRCYLYETLVDLSWLYTSLGDTAICYHKPP